MDRRHLFAPIAHRLLCAFILMGLLAFAPQASAQELETGKQQFISHCAACHGEDGRGGVLGPGIIGIRNPRATSSAIVHGLVRSGIPDAGMPAFNAISDAEVDSIAAYVMALKTSSASASPAPQTVVAGDIHAGRDFFLNRGNCTRCHAIQGRGGVVGPDLGSVGDSLTPAQLRQALLEPGSLSRQVAASPNAEGADSVSYAAATIRLRDGKVLHGALRNESRFDVQLMGLDGRLRLLSKDQIAGITREPQSLMPRLQATDIQTRDLVAYLSRLKGTATDAALLPPLELGTGVAFADVAHPRPGEWPSYNGAIGGNRFSPLKQINTTNIARLTPRWSFTLPGARAPLENTPQVVDGIMYVTASNECFALDARSGTLIWHYSRPRTKDLVPTGDAAYGINRGVAILGDRVFMVTDNAHLIALQRYTGKLVWETEMVDYHLNYGATQAPLVVGDLVISGISGGDEGVRGFVSAYKASTGERVWRFWTVPGPGEPGSESWIGSSINHPGSSTWMTGTYDPEADILYWGVGNPGPDFNGDQRKGDNLYSCSILALNPHTGALIWYRQMTPHNTNDWDATQTPMLVDAVFHGKPRKLLIQANRNGFLYVLDRLTGDFLLGAPLVHNLTWASGLDAKGRPIIKEDPAPTPEGKRVCPTGAGATNWPSASFTPQTGQLLVFATESCQIFSKNEEPFAYGKSFYQGGERNSPGDTRRKFLRAFDIQTGRIAWEIPDIGTSALGSGLMTTAGGFVFYGDDFGTITAADVRNGKILWHFSTGQPSKGGPMAYTVDGKEHLVLIAGQTVFSFGLR